MAVKNKDKGSNDSGPSRTITADEVRTVKGVFDDEAGDIADRVAGLCVYSRYTFKLRCKTELLDDDAE